MWEPYTQITSGHFSFTIDEETHEVGPGDTLLKTDGAVHGCTCPEAGVLLDIFNPMREDFLSGQTQPHASTSDLLCPKTPVIAAPPGHSAR